MSNIGQFLRGAITTGGLVALGAVNLYLVADTLIRRETRTPSHSGKPCGDLVVQPYERIDGQYHAAINVATQHGLQKFPFTWAPEREDLTELVEQAIIQKAEEHLRRQSLSWRELYVWQQQGPLGWLEVTCEEGKEPCQVKQLRSTCWGE